jgi:aldehyde dehydrogenase (NAD+)/betaine-aldehyde dehydrogenase
MAAQRITDVTTNLLIGGRFVRGAGGDLTVVNPATEETVAVVPQASVDQLDAAVAAARTAFDEGEWPRLDGAARAERLHAAVDHLAEHRELLTDTIVAEIGCPVSVTRLFQVEAAIQFFRWYADAARTDRTRPLPADTGPVATEGIVRYLPVGVVGSISAYNYPLMLAVNKVGAVLATGCTVVLMPSPFTPLTTLLLGRLLHEAGLPAGTVNVVVGDATIARRLTEHPDVDKVSFTGSLAVGSAVAQQAAASIKEVVLELGGKSACILLPDTDLNAITKPLLLRLFRNAGQGCQVPSRILVHRDQYAGFAERARAAIDDVVIGDPWDDATEVGPLIDARHKARVQQFIDEAVAQGADVLAAARLPQFERGHWIAPTLVGGVKNDARIAQEEVFGPVGVVLTYEDPDEAVAIANDTQYGLAAYVYGADKQAALDIGARLRAGSVFVNGGALRPDAPSGGFKRSGIGREQGEEGILEFLEPQHLRWAT